MSCLKRNKLKSFSLIELITALIISGIVIVLVFSLLNRIQVKLKQRRDLSSVHADRAILLKHNLKLLHQEAINSSTLTEASEYVVTSKIIEGADYTDTLSIQLNTTELQKFNYGIKFK